MPPLALRIPHDSNLNYLPLVYFLPEDAINSCPTLHTLPRCFGEIARSEKMLGLINSDAFLIEIADAASSLAFPHFGFGGWKEHYTGYSPVWQLSYFLPIWAKLLEEETGWGVQRLFSIPFSEYIPFFDPETIRDIMRRVVKRGITEQNWQPILDAVREMPCHEDFELRDTRIRRDFIRKWYHTRSKRVRMVSLEECSEDKGHSIHMVRDKSADFESRIIAEDYCQRFKARLSPKDREILTLRIKGYTYEEIADRLGYQNHSGVIKRMQAITKAFIQYRDKA